MASLKLHHIYKVYPNGAKAVNDFNIDIEDKEFIVFVGPSGCGKSTTLRMIAGLEDITSGELFIDDKLMNNAEPKDRDIAFVFQNYALYPHMTVYENMAFGLKNRHYKKDEINRRVLEAAQILELNDYLDRKPKEMSGGQRQRVALGRALVRDPKVFLLDEPLSNLDAKLRGQMRTEITKLHQKVGTTFIYVTHDQVEAMTMGTRIVVMKDGFIQQIDSPMNLYNKPANRFVASFIGTPQMNFFNATLSRDKSNVTISLTDDNVSCEIPYAKLAKVNNEYFDNTKKVILGIRPEHINVSKDDKNAFKCRVQVIEQLGNEAIGYGSILDNNLNEHSQIVFKYVPKDSPVVNQGEIVNLCLNDECVHLFDSESEESLIKDIPECNSVTCKVVNDTTKLFKKNIELPEALKPTIADGEYTLRIPTDAIIEGNDFSLTIDNVEEVNGKYIIRAKDNNQYLYFQSDEAPKEKKFSFSIQYEKIELIQDGILVIKKLESNQSFQGKILRKKAQKDWTYSFQINSLELDADIDKVAKIALADGVECHKKTYSFILPMEAFSLQKEGFDVTFGKILDYGTNKFVTATFCEKEILIPYHDEDLILSKLSIDISKLKIYSLNNILLA